MARDRANIRIDMWADQDWRELSLGAQHLYMLLLSHPTLSYAGVVDWKPGRLAAMTQGTSKEQIVEHGAELQAKYFVVFDEETEEVLIRSFIKHDGLLKQPKLVVSMMNAYAAIASKTLRQVLVFEAQKLHKAEPDLKVWTVKQSQTLLKAKGLDAHSLTPPFRVNADQGFTPAFTPNSDQAQGLPTSTSTSTSTKDLSSTISSRREDVVDNFSPLCELLADGVWENLKAKSKNPQKVKRPKVTKVWLDSMRLLIYGDGHDADEVREVITWALGDEFWKSNIMSPGKLRIQFDQLLLKKPVGPQKPRSLEHRQLVDPVTQEPYCQSCGQTWPCLTESKKGGAKF